MTPLSPEGGQLIEDLIQAGKWLGGTLAAAWIAFRWSIKAGEQKRKYAEMEEDVENLKSRQSCTLTRLEHEDIQRVCQSNVERMIDAKIHNAVIDFRDQMDVMNANLCRIMGKLDVSPVDPGQPKKRRQTDGVSLS